MCELNIKFAVIDKKYDIQFYENSCVKFTISINENNAMDVNNNENNNNKEFAGKYIINSDYLLLLLNDGNRIHIPLSSLQEEDRNKISQYYLRSIENRIEVQDRPNVLDENKNTYNIYAINIENRSDRKESFKNKMSVWDRFNINFFRGIYNNYSQSGNAMSHLALIYYAKSKNMPYIIIVEDDISITNYDKLCSLMDRLIIRTDWSIFNGTPSFYGRSPIFQKIANEEELIHSSWGLTTNFMIYNKKSYDIMLDYEFRDYFDIYVCNNFIQTIYKNGYLVKQDPRLGVDNTHLYEKFENNLINNVYDTCNNSICVDSVGKTMGIIILATNIYFILGLRFMKKFMYYHKGNCKINFYFFSDTNVLEYLPPDIDNVHYYYATNKNWVEGVNSKFPNIISIEKDLKDCDYVYFFDADTNINRIFNADEILGDIVAGEHYDNINMKTKPYDRNPRSKSYVPFDTELEQTYFYGAFFGGKTDKTLNYIKQIREWQLENSKINHEPIWNDESYINKYFHYNKPTLIVKDNVFKNMFVISDKGSIDNTRNTSNKISDTNLLKLRQNKYNLFEINKGEITILRQKIKNI